MNEDTYAIRIFISILSRYTKNLDEIHVNVTPASTEWVARGWVTVIKHIERGDYLESFILKITDDGQVILDFDKL